MVHTTIKNVWDLFYYNLEEIADAENAKEIISQYSEDQQIPFQVLELDTRCLSCIVLAGEAALYPWKVGQSVELGLAKGIIWHCEYLRELCIKGIDNTPYQDFVLYDSIKPIRYGEITADSVVYKGIASFKIYTGLGKHIIFEDDFYLEQRRRRSKMRHLISSRSLELPQDEQWGENWKFECSRQCYELDTEFKDKYYFDQMDDEEKLCLIRKMENFIEERGVSVSFARNFALLDQACREIDERQNSSSGDDYSCSW